MKIVLFVLGAGMALILLVLFGFICWALWDERS